MLERAECWHLRCDYTGAEYLVQFWDTHKEDRHGKRRMAFALFQRNPTFPSNYHLLKKATGFYPRPSISCDGPDAAKEVVAFMCFEDTIADELIAAHCDESEIHLVLR